MYHYETDIHIHIHIYIYYACVHVHIFSTFLHHIHHPWSELSCWKGDRAEVLAPCSPCV